MPEGLIKAFSITHEERINEAVYCLSTRHPRETESPSRHCEERSDEAIYCVHTREIAALLSQ